MVHCNALHCKNNSRKFGVDVIRYFSYPRNAELRQKWAAKTRPDGKQVPYYASICQRHFKPSQLYYTKFGALKFKPGEVPTLFKPKVCKEDEPAEFEEYADPQQEYYFAKSYGNLSKLTRSQAPTDDHCYTVRTYIPSSYRANKDNADNDLEQPVKMEPGRVEAVLLDNDEKIISRDFTDVLNVEVTSSCHECRIHSLHREHQNSVIENQQKYMKTLESRIRELETTEKAVKSVFRADQIRNMGLKDRNSHRYSDETMKDAGKILESCGNEGYKTLKEMGYPLPCYKQMFARSTQMGIPLPVRPKPKIKVVQKIIRKPAIKKKKNANSSSPVKRKRKSPKGKEKKKAKTVENNPEFTILPENMITIEGTNIEINTTNETFHAVNSIDFSHF